MASKFLEGYKILRIWYNIKEDDFCETKKTRIARRN